MQKVLILNGPNLNLLGLREPHLYGDQTLDDIVADSLALGQQLGLSVECRQSNHEGALIDWIQAARGEWDAIVINAGGLTHTSVALMDALTYFGGPVVEVHISQIHRREEFRHHSHISRIAQALMCGMGWRSYGYALRYLADHFADRIRRPAPDRSGEPSAMA